MKKRIRELRKTLGLTMEQFGAKLGVKKNTISQWENGVNNLTDQMLIAICNVNWNGKYVNKDWLQGNSDKMFKSDSDDNLKFLLGKYRMTDMEYNFLKEYFKLEPSIRETFFETLNKIFSGMYAGDISASVQSPSSLDVSEKNIAKKQPLTEFNLDELSNEELGKLVRKDMELEEKVGEKSEALRKNA